MVKLINFFATNNLSFTVIPSYFFIILKLWVKNYYIYYIAPFGFELLLIDRGDNATAQRHFLKLLEHEVALAVVVVEMFTVFGKPPAGIILAVVLLSQLKNSNTCPY